MIGVLFNLYISEQVTTKEFHGVCKHLKDELKTHDLTESKDIAMPTKFNSVMEKVHLYGDKYAKQTVH